MPSIGASVSRRANEKELVMAMRKKPSNKKTNEPRRTKSNTAGSGESSKTRADVPATHARKAASGKQTGR